MKVLLVFVVACIVVASCEETKQLAEEVKDEEIEPAQVGDGDEDAEIDVNNDAIDHDEIDLDHAQEDSRCRDFRDDCKRRSKRGDCNKSHLMKTFMNQYCPKSCNMCRGGYVITPHGGGSLHSTCKDFRADCKRGDCKKRYLQIFMNQYCQKTCNMCRGGYVLTPHGGGSLPAACSSNPCQNGGTCADSGSATNFYCICSAGWTGNTCTEAKTCFLSRRCKRLRYNHGCNGSLRYYTCCRMCRNEFL